MFHRRHLVIKVVGRDSKSTSSERQNCSLQEDFQNLQSMLPVTETLYEGLVTEVTITDIRIPVNQEDDQQLTNGSTIPEPGRIGSADLFYTGINSMMPIPYGLPRLNRLGQDVPLITAHSLAKRDFASQEPIRIASVQRTKPGPPIKIDPRYIGVSSKSYPGEQPPHYLVERLINDVMSGVSKTLESFANQGVVSNLPASAKQLQTSRDDSTGDEGVDANSRCLMRLDFLLNDKNESDKAILKTFLFEVIINEKLNRHRMSFLPSPVVKLLLLFLEKHYSFRLHNAVKKGTLHKYLFPLKGHQEEQPDETELMMLSFRFRFELFFEGAKKKLPKIDTPLSEEYYVAQRLFDKIHVNSKLNEESRSIKMALFWSFVKIIYNKDQPLTTDMVKSSVPKPLMKKLLSLSPDLLHKYYSIKLKHYLSNLFAGSMTTMAQIKQRIKVSEKFPFFSDLMHDTSMKTSFERRNYQIGPTLDLG
jgi:hypothetical protein